VDLVDNGTPPSTIGTRYRRPASSNMRLPAEQEAILASAAHYFIATRSYSDAIAVLQCCLPLTGYPNLTPKAQEQLEAVNALTARLFTGWPKTYTPEQAQLSSLRQSLRKLRKLLVPEVRRRRGIQTIYQALHHVERRPGMFLRHPTVEHISLFMQTLYPSLFCVTEGDPPFRSFPAWVDRRFPKHQGGGHAWDQVLLSAAGGDQDKAFKLFFRELRAFRRSEKGA